ncbi:MAG: bifunctional transaldolase/phosoglucose isomerase [Candidatus Sumerlaeaceae bacterium]
MKQNPLKQLLECGQSFWMDTISREMIQDGTLKRMIREDGLRGVTSNPDIFQKAISGSNLYDDQIKKLALGGMSSAEIYEALAVADIQKAADVLQPVFESSNGVDGLISLEVSPYLAFDTKGTIEEAHRLWEAVGRENVFIKVPATPAGIPAIKRLIADGINVNVTLIFSLDAYAKVMEAYIAGIEQRVKTKLPVKGIVSVASFFVSRIDVLVDKLIANRIVENRPKGMPAPQEYLGKTAIACAKVAYQDFKETFSGARWKALARAGAKVQRPLWASTSSKNSLYAEDVYVTPLIGEDTVNTMPLATIDAWRARGVVRCNTIEDGVEDARAVLRDLKKLGVDLTGSTWQVMEEGVTKFNQPFDKLLGGISQKRAALVGWPAESQTENLGSVGKQVSAVLESMSEARFGPRLYGKDVALFAKDAAQHDSVANRLGWIDVPEKMQARTAELTSFAAEVKKAGFKQVVLLGMGGSSLCPEVCAEVFGSKQGYPQLIVLDTTSPEHIAAATGAMDVKRSLFIAASKSGGTIETMSLFKYFWKKLEEAGVAQPGGNFIAITDPGTSLGKLAKEKKFRKTFENPADIGGRYSALSLFGLVPMAMIGMDVKTLLERAVAFSRDGRTMMNAALDPGIRLGAALGVLAKSGRNKMTLITSPQLASLGSWIEQLVAESTGKEGKGILPVDLEPVVAADTYGNDRVFVSIELAQDPVQIDLAVLEKAGAPVIRIRVGDAINLGAEFYRWEVATATAGALLGINPFDEPNVSESKQITGEILKEYKTRKRVPLPKPALEEGGFTVTLSKAARAALRKNAGKDSVSVLRGLAATTGNSDYITISAFLPAADENQQRLAMLRAGLLKFTKHATTLGFGPRYLHSTGQLHKGGPNTGVFFVIMSQPKLDVDIPGEGTSFGALIQSQAIGDFRALDNHERRAALINLGNNVDAGLKKLATMLKG